MSKPEDPLGEIGLNTTRGMPNSIRNELNAFNIPIVHTIKESLSDLNKENINILHSSKMTIYEFEILNNSISDFIKSKSSPDNIQEVSSIHKIFSKLYQYLKQIHAISQYKYLIKQHLMVIGKLLMSKDTKIFNKSSEELLFLYNESNWSKVARLDEILLADFTYNNNFYLSTLKIFTLQFIIKAKLLTSFQLTVLKLFSHDTRYLLKDPKIKINAILKIILNSFSLLPNVKVLFGLKFLQYINQYKISFETFVKNMTIETFEKQLCVHYSRCENKSLLSQFIYSYYSSYITIIHHSSPLKSLIHKIYNQNENIIQNVEGLMKRIDPPRMRVEIQLFSPINRKSFYGVVNEIILTDSICLSEKAKLLQFIWKSIIENNNATDKKPLTLFDETLIFINSNIKFLNESKDDLRLLFLALFNFCILRNEFRRISNIVNVLFNCSMIFKDYELAIFATRQEISTYMIYYNNIPRNQVVNKIEKIISSISPHRERLEVFFTLYNFYFTSNIATFPELLEECQLIATKCTKRLELPPLSDFSNCSEVQLAILYSNSRSPITALPPSWSSLSVTLFSSLSGNIKFIIPEESKKDILKYHFLYPYERLIKLTYYLNIEMSKHITSNLYQITKSYEEKWMDNSKNRNNQISILEVDFIKTLLQYLNSSGFHKTIIQLTDQFKLEKDMYYPVLFLSEKWRLEAYRSLQVSSGIYSIEEALPAYDISIEKSRIEKTMTYLELKMQLILWKNDPQSFSEIFRDHVKSHRPELTDIQNNSKMLPSLYIKILLFNAQSLVISSKLHIMQDAVIESVIDAKKALKLSFSLLKKVQSLSQSSRLTLIKILTVSYINLIEVYIRIGIAKDADFFAKEFLRVIGELSEPTWVFRSLHFLHQFYSITGQTALKNATLQKANKTFEYLVGTQDIESLTMNLYDNGYYDDLFNTIDIYFEDMEQKDTFLPNFWRLKLGEAVDDFHCIPEFRPLNSINRMHKSFDHTLQQLQADPFFKGLFDSPLASPSCIHEGQSNTNSMNTYIGNNKDIIGSIAMNLPRSSNMTPKSKNLKQKFDRFVAVKNLQRIISSIKDLKIISLDHDEIRKLSSLYALCNTLLSNIDVVKETSESNLVYSHFLADITRTMPLYYDKILSSMDKEIYEDMSVLEFNKFENFVTDKVNTILLSQDTLRKIDCNINIISIDICNETDNLLLSKYSTGNHKRMSLRIPLKGSNARDLDIEYFSFIDAFKELSAIIEQNNYTTSSKVTSDITTPEGRKKWWDTRYDLDKRLKSLLENIESKWFSGFKSFMSPQCIHETYFIEFKLKFYDILQQHLPSRKQYGNSSMFFQIEDWVVELFLKLNMDEANFMSMIEDLIFFVLDILLYHGEENAYDEIEISQIFVDLVDEIKKYHSKVKSQGAGNLDEVSHTFLIVSSNCHIFPWESLPFMKDISVSRVPSLTSLVELLKKNSEHERDLPMKISTNQNLAMILNPNGDLKKTESRFGTIFQSLYDKTLNSKLLVNQRPTEEQFLSMIRESNLFIYVGHGSGEQYARLKQIKQCNGVAASFLLGCSSAAMKCYSRLEPSGSVYSYILAGSPLVVGTLWDVTDKDIDKFSMSLFEKIGLVKSLQGEIAGYQSISKAITASRDVCHLKYLNGAATVMYGLPAKFT